MYRFSLLIRAIRWRASSSLVLLLVATVAMLAASTGPIYLLAAEESVIKATVNSATVPDRGLTLTADLNLRVQGPPPQQRAKQALDSANQVDLQRWFGAAINTSSVHVALSRPSDPDRYEMEIVARDNVCDHIRLIAGRCPQMRDEVTISDRSASQINASIGTQMAYRIAGEPAPHGLNVVGVYVPGDSAQPYWFGRNFFTYAPPLFSLAESPPFELDAFFATAATIDSLPLIASPLVTAEMPLKVNRVDDGDLATLKAALAAYSSVIIEKFFVSTASRLPAMIAQLQEDERQMAEIIALTAVQLELVGLAVLYTVVSVSAATREQEVGLARLRGHGPLGVVNVGLLEPLVLVAASCPLGIGLAWLAVWMMVGRLLLPGTPVVLDALTLGVAAAALAGGILAVAIGASRLLARNLAEQLRSTSSPGNTARLGQIFDVAAVTLAAAGLVELAINGTLSGGQANPLAIVAPGLLCLAVAVIGVRLLAPLCTPLLRSTSASSATGIFIAVRRLARVPEDARQILVPALALGLTMFALFAWSVADTNRGQLARFQIGADRVLVVSSARGVDLVSSVRNADPGGRDAMAAVKYTWTAGTVLAVDSSRFAAVADWPLGIADRDSVGVAKWLQPTASSPIVVRGSAMRIGIVMTTGAAAPPSIDVTLVGMDHLAHDVSIGPLLRGSHQYAVDLPASCSQDCRITTLTQTWPSGFSAADNVTALITGLEVSAGPQRTWQPTDAGWSAPAEWRAVSPDVLITQAANPSGLELSFANISGAQQVASADVPANLTAVVTPDQVVFNGSGNSAAIYVEGLDRNSLLMDGRVHASAIPRLGPSGVLVDLTFLEREQRLPTQTIEEEVWLSAHAPPDLIHRLANQGITVVAAERAGDLKARLDHQGLPLAYALMPLAAVVATALAFGSTIFAIAAGARRRSYELAILRACGWTYASLARGVFGEQLVLVATACVLGAAAGIAGAWLALPSVPEFTNQAWNVPLQFNIPWLLLIVAFAAITTILLITVALAIPGLLASAGAARLTRGGS